MPIRRMPIDRKKIMPAKADEAVITAMAAGAWLTPRVPVKYSSSFKPTQKSQSGEFSGVPQTDRVLPKFNAAALKNRFNYPVAIGVRSPYALVNSILHNKNAPLINWEGIGETECRKLFEQHLGTITKETALPYEELFDPVYGSRLFAIPARKVASEFAKKRFPSGHAEDDVLTGATSATCTDTATWVASTTEWLAGGSDPTYDAPVQGSADDCWFIAALSSIAWVQPEILTADNSCGLFILDPQGPLTGQELLDDGYIYPSDDLPVPSGGDATSYNFWWSHSKKAERWVAMMEKAFAIRYLKTGQDHPNVCTLPKGDPQYALYVMMGDLYWQRFWNATPSGGATSWKNENGTVTYTTDALWTLLDNNCTSPTNKAFKKTTRPSVAFTYNSASVAPRLPGGGLLRYTSDLLVASHSYSLLGIVTENGKKYVVLRNPWGIINGATWDNHLNLPLSGGSLANGPMPGFLANGTVDQALWTKKSSGGKLYNGVFALDLATFARYFRGFSWA